MRLAILALGLAMLASPLPADAQNCGSGPRASLTNAPCPPRKPAKVEKEVEKKPKRPGTFEFGNTTVTIGGSVSGGVSTRIK